MEKKLIPNPEKLILNILEDNETRNESQPLANSTIIKYENVKPEEDKSIQTENSLDLILPGEIGANCEVELIGEIFWMIPDNLYYDSWHTHSDM